jgi:hypothetical protein
LVWLKEEATVIHPEDPDCLHINILELFALIINIWLALVFITHSGNIPGRHIIVMLADNTSALSLMRYTSCPKCPVVHELNCFIMDLTFSCPMQHKLSWLHLQGILNVGADKLSQFKLPAKGGG